MSGRVLPVVGSTQPWRSGPVTEAASCVLAPNPSPWTLDGTNTWLLTAPGTDDVLVVDPGPREEAHAVAIAAAARATGRRIAGIVLTHGHADHAESAAALAADWRVRVRAVDPALRLGDEGLAPGETIRLGDGEVRVIATPGHTADSVCLFVPHDGSVLTGDTVLGRGTSVVAWPDGNLAAYLDSLARLAEVVGEHEVTRLLPGHGPALDDPAAVISEYREHRRGRLAEVAAVVASGVTEPAAIVEIVYAEVPRVVWPAAEQTVRAQLDYLAQQ